MSAAFLPVYDRDLVIVKGRGARVTDRDGREYLDFAAGIGVNGLGHADGKVVAAIKKQAGLLVHVSNLYHHEPGLALAERLAHIAFPAKVFFSNSGAEAIEGAIKIARRIGGPGRTELIAFEGSFHGRTTGALALTWTAKYREPFEPLLPGVHFAKVGDIDSVKAVLGPKTAAVFIEPVQGESGVRPIPPAFLKELSALTREAGALLVADEIQCGLGRTGKMFGYQHAGITPDIVTCAKPLGGGLPLGAILLREDLAPQLHVGDHGSTFGGNPVACAASLAVLDRLTSAGFLEKVETRSASLLRGLRKLARAYPKSIAEVRGLGLMIGVEMQGPAGPVVKGLRDRGVIAIKAGDRVLRLLPPLMVGGADVKRLLTELESVLKEGAGAVVAA
jgi:predicted acetylornithine/succinylornithine family transaminase